MSSFDFEIKGKIVFDPPELTNKHEKQSSWKRVVIAMIDCPDFWKYYSWFIKKRYNLELVSPIRGTHFTVINDRIDNNFYFEYAKSKYDGKPINIKYNIDVRTNDSSWWLNAYSDEAEQIRIECGLPAKPYFDFHITIGRADGPLRLEHSKYIHHLIKTFGKEYG